MMPQYTSPARSRALEQLARIDPVGYGQSRNDLDGAVTRLSSYLRHGVLSLAEVRDAAIAKAGGAARCYKLLQELAWRDYYQRVWRVLANNVWKDIEPYKTGFKQSHYADELPADLLAASTGIDYIDYFVNELHSTGYLHNHARMWLAAYVVHARKVKWQAGARWFLSHLLDGDEASNNLSWQWCASTFSHKPYIYNRQNVLKYSGNRFAEHQHTDPFDADYESISRKFFRSEMDMTEANKRFDLRTEIEDEKPLVGIVPSRTLVWVHDGMMSPVHPAVSLGKNCVFVWDDQHIAKAQHSQKRIEFQRSALFCPDVHTLGKSVAEVLIEQAKAQNLDSIITGDTPDPRLRHVIAQLGERFHVEVVPERAFVELSGRVDLTRFSRYWGKAESAMKMTRTTS
jgi:deoxyribodipyrimidine photo-lyase